MTDQPAQNADHQLSIEDVDEDVQPQKAVSKKASHILELADGSEDEGNVLDSDLEAMAVDPSNENTIADSDKDETPAESAEAELWQVADKYLLEDLC